MFVAFIGEKKTHTICAHRRANCSGFAFREEEVKQREEKKERPFQAKFFGQKMEKSGKRERGEKNLRAI